MMKTEQSLQEARVDKEGFLIADEGTHHYLLAVSEEDEELVTVSNMRFFLHRLAAYFSAEGERCLIVRADSHQVVFCYEPGGALLENYEEDPETVRIRKNNFADRVLAP